MSRRGAAQRDRAVLRCEPAGICATGASQRGGNGEGRGERSGEEDAEDAGRERDDED